MDLRVGGAGGADAWFVMPIAALNLFDTVAVLMAIPLCDRVIFPALRRPDAGGQTHRKAHGQRQGMRLSMLRKVGAGFVLAVT